MWMYHVIQLVTQNMFSRKLCNTGRHRLLSKMIHYEAIDMSDENVGTVFQDYRTFPQRDRALPHCLTQTKSDGMHLAGARRDIANISTLLSADSFIRQNS